MELKILWNESSVRFDLHARHTKEQVSSDYTERARSIDICWYSLPIKEGPCPELKCCRPNSIL
jgi:hypothetical protein